MPPWGRPPGAKGSKRRKQWEREQALWQEQSRVEELDSDDTDTQGVGLNFTKKNFASDPLQSTGIDLASKSRARRSYVYDETEDSSEEDEDEDKDEEGGNTTQVALRDKEETLVQSALARIRRAQEKGKREVKLNQDELDALEKRRKRMQSAATMKPRKGSGSSGSGSERRRRSDRQLVTVPIAQVEPSSRKGKSRRIEDVPPHPPAAAAPPGMLVAGPEGLTYAPLGHYPPAASTSHNSPTRPRSATSHGTSPPQFYQPPQSSRHFSDNTRPTSSSSNGPRPPLPHEEGWMPSRSRQSSVSSQQYSLDPFEYQTSAGHRPPIPQQYMQSFSNRSNVSGHPEVSYSSVRRSPPVGTGYPAAARGLASDPMLVRRSVNRDDGEVPDSQESTTEEEEDESDDLGNGVQVFVEREVERAIIPARKPVGRGRKKGKGR